MEVLCVPNVHYALPEGLRLLRNKGVESTSRNGPVLVVPGPVTTWYRRPEQRVIFWEERDANPFFHLMESLWMLAGRNDVAFVAQYVQRMRSFSDDGKTLHGAYGHRWRQWFGFDQLGHIIEALKANPTDRRNVLQMWDARSDLGRNGKDVPCNTQAYFSVGPDGRLDMTVCCRSNDVVWGAYGANAVHFSFLQEYVARSIGIPVGQYWQISNNYHGYRKTVDPLMHLAQEADKFDAQSRLAMDPYKLAEIEHFPIMQTDPKDWQVDLQMFLGEGPIVGLRDPFFRRVVIPMEQAYRAYKKTSDPGRFAKAKEILEQCKAMDWRLACTEWIERREAAATKREQEADDGVKYE